MKKTKTCTRCIDRSSKAWFIKGCSSYAFPISVLDQVRHDYQDRLFRTGYVTLIDILNYLGLPVSREALTLGWVWDDKEKFPTLSLFTARNGDVQVPFDNKITIEFIGLVDLSKILDPDTALE